MAGTMKEVESVFGEAVQPWEFRGALASEYSKQCRGGAAGGRSESELSCIIG